MDGDEGRKGEERERERERVKHARIGQCESTGHVARWANICVVAVWTVQRPWMNCTPGTTWINVPSVLSIQACTKLHSASEEKTGKSLI